MPPPPPSAVSGDCGMVRDYRGTAPCQCPQATDCIRVGGFIKRCSGVGTASALSKEIVPGSHTVALPLLPLHSSRVGPWLSSLVHNHHWLPSLVSSACQKQVPLSTEAWGGWYRRENLYCFGGAGWRTVIQQLPHLSCLHSHSHILPSRWAATTAAHVQLSICAHGMLHHLLILELYASILRGKRKKKNGAGWKISMNTYKENVSMMCVCLLLFVVFFFFNKVLFGGGGKRLFLKKVSPHKF